MTNVRNPAAKGMDFDMDLNGNFFQDNPFDDNFAWMYEPNSSEALPDQTITAQRQDLDDGSGSGGIVLPSLQSIEEAPVAAPPPPVITARAVVPPPPLFKVTVNIIKPATGRERLSVLGAVARESISSQRPLGNSALKSSNLDDGTNQSSPVSETPSSSNDNSSVVAANGSADDFSIMISMMRAFHVDQRLVPTAERPIFVAMAMAAMTKLDRRRKFLDGLRAYDHHFMRCVARKWKETEEKQALDLEKLILGQMSDGTPSAKATAAPEVEVESDDEFTEVGVSAHLPNGTAKNVIQIPAGPPVPTVVANDKSVSTVAKASCVPSTSKVVDPEPDFASFDDVDMMEVTLNDSDDDCVEIPVVASATKGGSEKSSKKSPVKSGKRQPSSVNIGSDSKVNVSSKLLKKRRRGSSPTDSSDKRRKSVANASYRISPFVTPPVSPKKPTSPPKKSASDQKAEADAHLEFLRGMLAGVAVRPHLVGSNAESPTKTPSDYGFPWALSSPALSSPAFPIVPISRPSSPVKSPKLDAMLMSPSSSSSESTTAPESPSPSVKVEIPQLSPAVSGSGISLGLTEKIRVDSKLAPKKPSSALSTPSSSRGSSQTSSVPGTVAGGLRSPSLIRKLEDGPKAKNPRLTASEREAKALWDELARKANCKK